MIKKVILLASALTITGCAATITMPPNVTVSQNDIIEDIVFEWNKNKNLERTAVCIRKHMPVESTQGQDVIKATDTKTSEIVGYGSTFLRSPNIWTRNPMSIKFQYIFSNKGNMSTLRIHNITTGWSQNPLSAHTVFQADIFYANLSETASEIQSCK